MSTRTVDASAIDRTKAGAPGAIGRHGPVLLAEAELDHVAAAGSKPGASGGACCPTRPTRPK